MSVYEKLYEELAERLPNSEDREMLKGLIEALRKGGKEAVQEEIGKLITKLAGET